MAACWLVVLATFYHYPGNSLIGLALRFSAFPFTFTGAGGDTFDDKPRDELGLHGVGENKYECAVQFR